VKKILSLLLCPLSAVVFLIVAVLSFGTVAVTFTPVLAQIHLMDTLETYDYSFLNDSGAGVKEGVDYYDRNNNSISDTTVNDYYGFDNNADLLRVSGDYGYNAYLKSLVAGGKELPTVVVAVMDSGINMEHEIFAGRILTAHARNFSASNGAVAINDLRDYLGHGTHVAGSICDMTLPNVKILPIKIFGSRTQTDPALIEEALNYIIGLKKGGMNIVAVNMSLGTDPFNPNDPDGNYEYNLRYFQRYIDCLIAPDVNILPVVAAGNGYTNVSVGSPYPSLPAACDGAVSVASFDGRTFRNYDINHNGEMDNGEIWYHIGDINNNGKIDKGEVWYNAGDINFNGEQDDGEVWVYGTQDDGEAPEGDEWAVAPNNGFNIVRSGYSNYGQYIDIAAPGHNIWSARATGTTEIKLSYGTSMAAPFVSALYALLYSDPTMTADEWAEFAEWTANDRVPVPATNNPPRAKSGKFVTPVEKALFSNAFVLGSPQIQVSNFGYGCVSLAEFIPPLSWDGWVASGTEYESIMGIVPNGKSKISVATVGGGGVLRNDSGIPVAGSVDVPAGTDFKINICAAGGYSILSVEVDGQEIYAFDTSNPDDKKSMIVYTVANPTEKTKYAVSVRFSAFDGNGIISVPVDDSISTAIDPAPTDPVKLIIIALIVGGIAAVIFVVKDRKSKELFAQLQADGDDPYTDINYEVDRIIRELTKRGGVKKGSDLEAEVNRIMQEQENRGEDDERN
jgi:hypothetical protein